MAPVLSREIAQGPIQAVEVSSPFQELVKGATQGFWDGIQGVLGMGGRAAMAIEELARRGWEAGLIESLRSACWPKLFENFKDRELRECSPMLMVGHIMGLLYVGYVWVYLPVAGLPISCTNSIVFHSAFLASLASYYQALVTDPGKVPEGFDPRCTGMECHERKRSTNDFRWCNKENVYKPDRCHFCGNLNRNVLKMDHYCPWLHNTVGYYNHKHFALFLFYTVVATNIFVVQVGGLLLWGSSAPAGYTFLMLEGEIVGVTLSSLLTPFFFFHCWLISENLTTIEFCEKMGADTIYKSRYDVGLYANIKSVFGENPWLWLSPWHPVTGVGTQFPRAIEYETPENTSREDGGSDGSSPERTRSVRREHKCVAKVSHSAECMEGLLADLVQFSCLYNETLIDMWHRTNRICGFSWA